MINFHQLLYIIFILIFVSSIGVILYMLFEDTKKSLSYICKYFKLASKKIDPDELYNKPLKEIILNLFKSTLRFIGEILMIFNCSKQIINFIKEPNFTNFKIDIIVVFSMLLVFSISVIIVFFGYYIKKS